MATAIQLKQPGSYESFPDGYYPARCTNVIVEDKEPDQFHTEAYKQLRWSWALTIEGREDQPSYTTWTSLSLHEKSKLPGLLKALRVEPDESGSLNPSLAIGKSCKLNLQEIEYKDNFGAIGFKNKTLGYSPLQAAPRPANRPAPQRQAPPPADNDEVPF